MLQLEELVLERSKLSRDLAQSEFVKYYSESRHLRTNFITVYLRITYTYTMYYRLYNVLYIVQVILHALLASIGIEVWRYYCHGQGYVDVI